MEDAKNIIDEMKKAMEKTISFAMDEISKIRAGRVSPAIIENLPIDAYGTRMHLKELANISVKDARTLIVNPWDKNLVNDIQKGLLQGGTGASASIQGDAILVIFPPLTEETRKQLVKKVKEEGEKFKVSIRNARRDAIEKLRALKKDKALTEDDYKRWEGEVEKITKAYISKIDDIVASKERDIMSV